MRRCAHEPWWNWTDRWQIVDDYTLRGMTLAKLAIKYKHDRGQISGWIESLGIKRTPKPKPVKKKVRTPTPNIRELCRALIYATDKLGRPPNRDEIDRIMKIIADEGYWAVKQRKALAAD